MNMEEAIEHHTLELSKLLKAREDMGWPKRGKIDIEVMAEDVYAQGMDDFDLTNDAAEILAEKLSLLKLDVEIQKNGEVKILGIEFND